MSLDMSTRGIARASASRPWTTIAIWVGLVVVSFGLNVTLLGDALTSQFSFSNNPDVIRADELLETRLRGPKPIQDVILVKSEDLTVDDPAFQEKVTAITVSVLGLGTGGVKSVASAVNFYIIGDPSLVSEDRHTTIIPMIMAGDLDQATVSAEGVLAIVREQNGRDGFEVYVVGESSITAESNELATSDIEQGERFGVPVALIILLILFAAVVAALLPLFLAIASIIVALGATALVGLAFDLVFFVTLMITMIGLAVGIDYSLIVVSRFREEMFKGKSKLDAVTRTGATAGRTVFFSGVTVVFALAGMLIIPATIFQALGVGAILVVLAAMAASLTLLPAVLVLLGHRVNWLKIPFISSKLTAASAEPTGKGFWGWVTRVVMGHPLISLLLVGGLLIAAAVPVFDLKTGFNGVDTLPDSLQSKAGFFLLDEEFSFGVAAPTEIVVDADTNSQAILDAVAALTVLMGDDPDFVGDPTWETNPVGDLGLLTASVAGETSGERAVSAVKRLRDDYIPRAFAGTGADVTITGFTAFNITFFDVVNKYMPIVFVFVLGLSFLLLMVAFRSIVIPAKAIIMNLLSVGAAYGLLVLVFQKGIGADLGLFEESPIIDAWIPLFMFSVLFGLSMDYHVFLISRIRERFDETGDNDDAVEYGLRSTAGLITGAALIMVAVFSGFASGKAISNQQVGFGLAAAVLIDATLIRSILVPASMKLLGEWNWYLPKWLEWLPDVRIEAEETAGAPEPPAPPRGSE
jgi:RND superfamily putative drug exporter